MSDEVSWRSATKADRVLLEGFTCTAEDGPDYEQLVQRYFRSRAIAHLGAPDSLRSDHRLLLVLDNDALVAVACHRHSEHPDRRNLVFVAVRKDLQGQALSSGQRASDVLWTVVANDILDREAADSITVVARVDPANAPSLKFCERIGLRPGEPDANGLIICTGLLSRT